MGFDSISISSILEKSVGKKAHRSFLEPRSPILILEDMDLTELHKNSLINSMTIAPLRIRECAGIPCTEIQK